MPAAAVVRPPSTRWLSGPWSDLLLGCGLVYLVAFAALAVDDRAVRAVIPPAVTPFLVLLTGIPHYGATLLRVYERAADRQRYLVFGGFATVVLAVAFVVGLHDLTTGSVLLTVYLTWSPWHYSGQNYGIALVFLRRRGVAVSAVGKRLLQASFVLSFLLTAVMLHAVDPAVSYAPGQYEDSVYRLLTLDLPAPLVTVAVPALLGGYLAALAGAALSIGRRAALADLLPAAALVASQALWFVVPAAARRYGVLQDVAPLGTDQAVYAFLWIALTHAVQYLWIARYYAVAGGAGSGLRWGGKALVAGAAVWVLPALLFAPGVLGSLPFDAGLGLLVASVVNIHHFVLDGVIWKLRDGPIARILLRGQTASVAALPRRPWLARIVWAAGLASAGVWCFATYEQAFELEPAFAAGDVDRAEVAARRLGWVGQQSARVGTILAGMHLQRGDPERADARAREALALHPGADTFHELATFHHRARRGDAAIAAAEQAVALRPGSRPFRHRLAWLLATYRGERPADLARARALAAAVVAETGRRNATYLHTLAMILAAGGDLPAALATAEAALSAAEAAGEVRLAELLRARAADYRRSLGR